MKVLGEPREGECRGGRQKNFLVELIPVLDFKG